MDPADLNSPCRELSNGGLEIVVALLVRQQINFLSAQTLTLNPAVFFTAPFPPSRSAPGLWNTTNYQCVRNKW